MTENTNDTHADIGAVAPRLAAAMAEVRRTDRGAGEGAHRARVGRLGGRPPVVGQPAAESAADEAGQT